jgi:transcription initiation factor TFIIIB Brf1 subunit/transcription initiation factor TFIIB
LFESLKRHDTPRRPQEVADIFKIDLKLITRGVKQFAGLLDEHMYSQARKEIAEMTKPKTVETKGKEHKDVPQPIAVVAPIATPSTSFRHYLEPAILRLETPRTMTATLQSYADHYGNMLDELGVCPETTPPSLAACALSLACVKLGIPKANADIASVCGISMATLQKCLKRIEPWKPVLFKEEN